MDPLLLEGLLREIGPLVAGARVEKAYQYGPTDLALRLWLRPERKTLLLSADATAPLVALVDEEPAEPRGRFALLEAVRSRAVPSTLRAIEKLPGERIVILSLIRGGPGDGLTHRLVAELIPRASALLLLDPEDRVVAGTGPGLPGRRGLGTGKVWVPPPPPPPPGDGREALAGLSRLLQREVEARAGRDGVALSVARAALEAEARDAPDPGLTTEPGGKLVPTPMPFLTLTGTRRPFPSYTDLVAAYYHLAVVGRREATLRDRLRAAIGRRLEKQDRTRDRVAAEAERAEDADLDRRCGELLLAYQTAPVSDRGTVSLPDPEGGAGMVVVPLLDPERSLVDNARAYFTRYKTKRRAAEALRSRRAEVAAEREHLEELDAAAETGDLADLLLLAEELRREGVVAGGAPAPVPPRKKPRRPPPDPALAPRRFQATGGAEIRVGRTARGNAHLTFALARDHDFWLHADAPGAHVVLSNPERRAEPPPEALLEAAALAAWFSKLRGATRAEVHWTPRGKVRRVAGGPPGRVILGEHRSIRVAPGLAAERFGLTAPGWSPGGEPT